KPVPFSPFTRPGTTHPFGTQQHHQRKIARQAERRIGDSPHVPHVPLLRVYTPKQQRIIRRTYKQAAKRAGTNPQGLYLLGSSRQRQQMTKVTRRVNASPQILFNDMPAFYRGAYSRDPAAARAPNIEYHS